MKTKLPLLACIAVLSTLPLWAADGDGKRNPIEQRLREIDLSLTLRQYERVKMEVFETRLKMDLLDTEEELTEPARRKRRELLTARQEILLHRAAELRAVARDFAEDMPVAKVK